MYVICSYEQKPIDFQQCHFQNGRLVDTYWIFQFLNSNFSLALNIKYKLE